MEGSEHEKEKIERLRRAMYSRTLSGYLKERPRHALGKSKDQTEEDFLRRLEKEREEREQQIQSMVVAPRAIGYARVTLWWLLGIAILFFIAAVAFFGYYFLYGEGAGQSHNVEITVSGPSQVEGGSPTQLQVAVVNHNKVPLEVADIVITYPPGTRSSPDDTADTPNFRKSLGAIDPGETRRGTIPVVFAGNEGSSIGVHAELEYQIQGSNAIFTASTDYNTTLSSSPLSLVVDGNKEAISGQPIEMNVSVVSNATDPVRDVLFEAQYPFGFKFSSATPAPSKSGLWELGDLNPGQKVPIVIRGTLSGEQGDDRVFRFNTGTRQTPSAATMDTVLAKQEFPVAISKPFLGLTVSLQDANKGGSVSPTPDSFAPAADGAETNLVVAPGDDVAVTIAWQNNLPVAITDAVIAARLSGLAIDGSTVRTEDGFYRSTDNIVLWDKTTSSGALANLAPGAHGTVGFIFRIPSSAELGGLVVDPSLSISINAAGKRTSETGVPESLQSSITKKVAVASDVGFIARGLYYANPFGSVGPMPPKAEHETTYALVFAVTNSTNKITDARVTAHLPPYVRWIGVYSPASEDLKFNQADGTITWNIGELQPGVGLNGRPPRQAVVAVGFTPSSSQIGQEPALLKNIQLWGIDSLKAAATLKDTPGAEIVPEVMREARDITTNIQGDPGFSSANSTVVK